MVRTFGAPVTEPHGNRAAIISAIVAEVRAAMVDVICQTVSYRSTSNRRGTRTEPVGKILYKADEQIKEVNQMYLNLELDESLALAKELVSELNHATELALKLRKQALRWTHLIEWLTITGTSLTAGFVAWTTMIERRLYKDIETTRLSKNGSLTH